MGLIALVVGLTLAVVIPTVDAIDTSDWTGAPRRPTTRRSLPPRRSSTTKRTTPAPPPIAEPDLKAKAQTAYALCEGMPSFKVIPSTKDSEMHPCGNCHRWAESDPTPRRLKEPHKNFYLVHGLRGRGDFWCFTCHDLDGDGSLRTFEGETLDYDEACPLCSQCHVEQARD